MPGADRVKHSSDVILSVMSQSNALGTQQLLCCRRECLNRISTSISALGCGTWCFDSNHSHKQAAIKLKEKKNNKKQVWQDTEKIRIFFVKYEDDIWQGKKVNGSFVVIHH